MRESIPAREWPAGARALPDVRDRRRRIVAGSGAGFNHIHSAARAA